MPTVHARKRASIVLEQPWPVLLPEPIIRPGPFRLASGVEIRPARARPVGWPLRPGSRPIRPTGLTGTIHLGGRTAAIRTSAFIAPIRTTIPGTSRSLPAALTRTIHLRRRTTAIRTSGFNATIGTTVPGTPRSLPAALTRTIHLRRRTAAIRTAGLSPTIRSTMLGTSRSLASRLGASRRTAALSFRTPLLMVLGWRVLCGDGWRRPQPHTGQRRPT